METTRVAGTEVSRVGLGTWAIGGGDWKYGWGSQDEAEAVAAVERAVELGVNWVDTAPVYGFGISERIVGRAVAGLRSSAVTRCRDSTRDGLHPELNNHRSCRPGIHGAPQRSSGVAIEATA